MMSSTSTVLLYAPIGRDAQALVEVVGTLGLTPRICSHEKDLISGLTDDALMAILTDDVLMRTPISAYRRVLENQQVWSDFPILVLSEVDARLPNGAHGLIEHLGNVTLLRRPLHPESLQLAILAARRSRLLQFQLRDQLKQLHIQANVLERRVGVRTLALAKETHERRQAEHALSEARRLESLGRLTGGVAHDFNNLLQVIGGATQLLKLQSNGQPKLQKSLDSIERATKQGARMTQQLLSFARRQPMRLEQVELAIQLPAIAAQLRHTLDHGIIIHTEIGPDLQPISTDLGQLEAALLNLAVNARDAMPTGGVVTLAAYNVTLPSPQLPPLQSLSGEYVVIELRDQGTGMPPEVVQQAFEPFFTTKAPGKGTGLGLSQVDGFARQSAGKAFLLSSPKGSTVGIALPSAAGAADTNEARPPAQEVDTATLRDLRVLVVEDDPLVAEIAVAIFNEFGCRVCSAANADEAMDTDFHKIDLVFTDVRMPGSMDGIDLTRALAASHPSLPVVIASGFVGAPERLVDLKAIVVSKPYARETVATAAMEALALARKAT